MGFENSNKFGTPNLSEEDLYRMNRALNKALWEKGEIKPEDVKEEEVKKSGFTNK